MNNTQFLETADVFNRLLVEHLHCQQPWSLLHNYVRRVGDSKYIFSNLKLNNTDVELVISYDEFYQTPVLYYRIDKQVNHSNPYSVVDIHPLLLCPYLYIHPCETASLMQSVKPMSPLEYMISWFGIFVELIFPAIQLRVPSRILNQYI